MTNPTILFTKHELSIIQTAVEDFAGYGGQGHEPDEEEKLRLMMECGYHSGSYSNWRKKRPSEYCKYLRHLNQRKKAAMEIQELIAKLGELQ